MTGRDGTAEAVPSRRVFRSTRRAALTFAARRLALLPFALFGIVTASFALVNLVPSNPARAIAGLQATPAQVAAVKHTLGLDKPLPTRYWDYLVHLVHGDLGTSYFGQDSVGGAIAHKITSSAVIVVPALIIGVVAGSAFGIVGAYYRRRWPDRATNGVVSLFQATPDFLVGLVLIYVVFFRLRWAPAPSGQISFTVNPPPNRTGAAVVDAVLAHQGAAFVDALAHLVLPVLSLAIVVAAYFARTVRATLADALAAPSTEYARSCGLSEARVLRYAFRQSRTPMITYVGVLFASLLGGGAIVETIFAWNGLGQWALGGVTGLDLTVIQGFVLVVGAASLVTYMFLEIAVVLLDPRLTFATRRPLRRIRTEGAFS